MKFFVLVSFLFLFSCNVVDSTTHHSLESNNAAIKKNVQIAYGYLTDENVKSANCFMSGEVYSGITSLKKALTLINGKSKFNPDSLKIIYASQKNLDQSFRFVGKDFIIDFPKYSDSICLCIYNFNGNEYYKYSMGFILYFNQGV